VVRNEAGVFSAGLYGMQAGIRDGLWWSNLRRNRYGEWSLKSVGDGKNA